MSCNKENSMSTELIAEIGWNHLGDMLLAEEMIHAAKDSGADFAKFQTWHVNNLKCGPWDSDGRREIYEKSELSEDDHNFLNETCSRYGIKFLTSCFSIKDLDFIRSISDRVKIPGVECRNKELVETAIGIFNKVYLSTGTTSLSEIPLVDDNSNLVLMHCVSCYPCPAQLVNMDRMDLMKEKFDIPIGYSGHYHGIWDAILAIRKGAVVVEKHFTIDNNLPGRDNKFALLPDQFSQIRDFDIEVRKMNAGISSDSYLSEEQDGRDVYSGRWNG